MDTNKQPSPWWGVTEPVLRIWSQHENHGLVVLLQLRSAARYRGEGAGEARWTVALSPTEAQALAQLCTAASQGPFMGTLEPTRRQTFALVVDDAETPCP